MTPEEMEIVKLMRNAIEDGYTIKWYDLFALMIVGYWIGDILSKMWWWV